MKLSLIISLCLLTYYHLAIVVTGNTFHWNSQDTPQWQRNAHNTAVCVDIPSNLTLCQGIGYTKMRLPNLLNHDTLREVSQQSNSWVPLSQLNCHPDTRLFLCSLFSPVCLDVPIPPCRSLCESVQSSCEHIMLGYGYPWPKIVQCDQFPTDNDMCIQAQHSPPAQTHSDKKSTANSQQTDSKQKKISNKKNGNKKQRRNQSVPPEEYPPAVKETVFEPQPGHLQRAQTSSHLDSETRLRVEPQVDQAFSVEYTTTDKPVRKWNKEQRQLYNDIINNFCRSQWILKGRIFPMSGQKNEIRVRNYKVIEGSLPQNQRQTPIVLYANSSVIDGVLSQQTPEETQAILSRRRYAIIGKTEANGENWVTFMMQWPHKSPQLRKAIKAINNGDYNCQTSDNSQQFSEMSRNQKDRHNRERNSRRNSAKDKTKAHNS